MVVVCCGVIIGYVGELDSKLLLVFCSPEDCRHGSGDVLSSWTISSFRVGFTEIVFDVVNGMRSFWV